MKAKLLFILRIIGDIIITLMVIRTVIFMSWFLSQKRYSVAPDFWQSKAAAAHYDWSLWLTAMGWLVLFLLFTGSQKKYLAKPGDYQHIARRLPFLWLLNLGRNETDNHDSKDDTIDAEADGDANSGENDEGWDDK